MAVAGADTVVGRCALPGLRAAGHEVVALDTPPDALPDLDAAAGAMAGCDALVALPAQIPTGRRALRARSWRAHDLLRSEGVRTLTDAARRAGVRRVVLQSVSFVYADAADDWITEESPVCVTTATEPASVGELAVQRHAGTCRTGVVLRMGLVVGDSPLTRWSLRAAAAGRPVGFGDPDGYAHLIHSDDVGPAVAAALDAPSGIYNLGAEPVRRADLADRCAAAVGREGGGFLGSWATRLGRERLEPLRRSLRVSSARFSDVTGWSPRRERLDAGWFEAAGLPELVVP
ncbi:NAD-dependent epimerase/dehydratase family protein [Nocardioides caldifontis]|uniref:NAD-dependent epimerase/dehydratase family protein n=1 Tax=Nocardioides caldifontis TaxID=2588938 RepID=UPI0011E0410C|nr:NAD(P)-dependent oxidoreductase [Nocardioides caldifontis]